MRGATRILVTNALHVLPSCDTVSVIDNGTVAESGSYRELLGKRGGVLAAMVEAHSTKDDEESAPGTAHDDVLSKAISESDGCGVGQVTVARTAVTSRRCRRRIPWPRIRRRPRLQSPQSPVEMVLRTARR